MFKPSIDQIEDFLEMVNFSCPEEVHKKLAKFQPSCHDVDTCYDCWDTTVTRYQIEESLKSMNDEEDN